MGPDDAQGGALSTDLVEALTSTTLCSSCPLVLPFDPAKIDADLSLHASGVFSTLDSDGDGSITLEELKKAFLDNPMKVGLALGEGYGSVQRIKAHHYELKAVFNSMDVDGTGAVKWKAFQKFIWKQMLLAREIDATYLWRAKKRLEDRMHPTPHPTEQTASPTILPTRNPSPVPTVSPTISVMQEITEDTPAPSVYPTNDVYSAVSHRKDFAKFGAKIEETFAEIGVAIPTFKPTNQPTMPTTAPTFTDVQRQEVNEALRLVRKSGWNQEMMVNQPPTWLMMQKFYTKYNPELIPDISEILKHFNTEMIIVSQQKKYGAAVQPPAPTASPTAYPVPTVGTPSPTLPTYAPTIPTTSPVASMWDFANFGKSMDNAKANHVTHTTHGAPPTTDSRAFLVNIARVPKAPSIAIPTALPTAHPATASPTVYLPDDKTFGFNWVEDMVPKTVEKSLTRSEKRARLKWKVKRKAEILAHEAEVYKLAHPPAPTKFPTRNPTEDENIWAPADPAKFTYTRKPTRFPTVSPSSSPTTTPTESPTATPTAFPTPIKNNLQMFANIFGLNVMGYKPTLPPTAPCPMGGDDMFWSSVDKPARACINYNKEEDGNFHASCDSDHDQNGVTAHHACKTTCCRMTFAPTAQPTTTPTAWPTWSPTAFPTGKPTSRFDSKGRFEFHMLKAGPSKAPTHVKKYASKFDQMEAQFDSAGLVVPTPIPDPSVPTSAPTTVFQEASSWYKGHTAFHMPKFVPTLKPTTAPTKPPTKFPTHQAFVSQNDINDHAGLKEASDVKKYISSQLSKIEHAQQYMKANPNAHFAGSKELKKLVKRKQQLMDVLESLEQPGGQ
jgi:hypothetical protein